MRVVIFCHSLLSDWNHGNAHFLRGISTELLARDVDVRVYEPADAWSVENLLSECGPGAIARFRSAYPQLTSHRYELDRLDFDEALDGAQLTLVHEWNDPDLVRRIGLHHVRAGGSYTLLFHDTHHRSVSDTSGMSGYDLEHYDGVLAFGDSVAELYRRRGWGRRAWTWHEAADTRVFRPLRNEPESGELVWVGNWGDDERTAELHEYLLEPVRDLKINARVHGVRYPKEAIAALGEAGIEYAGWAPNFEVPQIFSRFRVTIHVPRRSYVTRLPGIPTIRMFEALACGIPLVSSPWEDREGLFEPGRDFLFARNGREMRTHLRMLLNDDGASREMAAHGLATIENRHTCSHRVDELLAIHQQLTCESRIAAGEI